MGNDEGRVRLAALDVVEHGAADPAGVRHLRERPVLLFAQFADAGTEHTADRFRIGGRGATLDLSLFYQENEKNVADSTSDISDEVYTITDTALLQCTGWKYALFPHPQRRIAVSKRSRHFLAMGIALACFCLFTKWSRGDDISWVTDFEAAKTKAKEEKKLLFVDFTGSDWCIWCKRLHGEVFDKEAFKADVPGKYIMVQLDFPHEKQLPDELKAQNAKLAKQYKIRGYPTILLLDPEGEVVAQTGYQAGGPEKYVAHLGNLITLHESVVKMRGESPRRKVSTATNCLTGWSTPSPSCVVTGDDDIDTWTKEIIALDTDNKAGLKGKYEVRQLMSEVAKLMQTRKYDDAKETIEKVLALPGLTATQKQDAYVTEATIAQVKMDRPACLAAPGTRRSRAAPESPKAKMLKSSITQIEQMIKNEEAAAKLKDELAKAEGEDRLTLLDETVTAYGKVGNRINSKDESADVAKWMDEIIKLDADNKAGLKAKYEYQSYYNASQKLLVSQAQRGLGDHREGPGTFRSQATADLAGDAHEVQLPLVAKGVSGRHRLRQTRKRPPQALRRSFWE